MKLRDLLSEEVVRMPLKNTEKNSIIEELVELLYRAGKLKDRDKALQAVLERERIMSTGMGEGVAIPHAKTVAVDGLVAAFGITSKDVDFQSIDDKPVRLVFLLIGPMDPTGPHLQALSRISRLMHRGELREKLISASSEADILRIIDQEEKKYL